LELRQLRYFVQICDAVSISEAAQRAHISQPALSRQIKLLEDELGVELLIRNARGIILTDAGTMLRDRATCLLKEASVLRHDVISSALVPHGELIVGTLTSLLAYLAAPALASFRNKYPEVTLKVIEGTSREMRDAVADGKAEIAFVSTLEEVEMLGTRPLLSEQLFLVGRQNANLDLKTPVSIASLDHAPLILTARPNSLRLIVDRALGMLGREAKVAFEVETLLLAMQLIQLNQGFSVFPYCAIDEYVTRGLVSAAPLEDMRISWALTYSKDRLLSTAARLFMDLVVEIVNTKAHDGSWLTARLPHQA
jgi:LysR family nitrogen assimilation transcriptional regulator